MRTELAMRGRVDRVATFIIVLIVAATVGACSTDQTRGGTSSTSVAPGSASASAPMTAAATDPTGTVRAAAERTFSAGTFHLESGFDTAMAGQVLNSFTSKGSVDVDEDAMSASATFRHFPGIPDGAVFRIVMIASQMWIKSSIFGDKARWVTFDVEEVAKINPQLAGLGTGMNDPRAASNFLAGAEDMRERKTQMHDGEEMTRYSGTVDFAKAVAAAAPAQREGMSESLKAFEQMRSTDAAATVWIDQAGYVREIRYVMTPKVNGQQFKLSIFSAISDIGGSVDIEEPSGDVIQAAA
jgi:hypothetical protein